MTPGLLTRPYIVERAALHGIPLRLNKRCQDSLPGCRRTPLYHNVGDQGKSDCVQHLADRLQSSHEAAILTGDAAGLHGLVSGGHCCEWRNRAGRFRVFESERNGDG